jgi:hypothetical protein
MSTALGIGIGHEILTRSTPSLADPGKLADLEARPNVYPGLAAAKRNEYLTNVVTEWNPWFTDKFRVISHSKDRAKKYCVEVYFVTSRPGTSSTVDSTESLSVHRGIVMWNK